MATVVPVTFVITTCLSIRQLRPPPHQQTVRSFIVTAFTIQLFINEHHYHTDALILQKLACMYTVTRKGVPDLSDFVKWSSYIKLNTILNFSIHL